ncbi:hypothetical protein R1sor_017827 [Riccia sorocarpa]|uniref:SAM domain-containing protein n=1 Tax=Riccia sorocarpa TaxID=122646 RepID=A0ABD3IBJ0_9MARC
MEFDETASVQATVEWVEKLLECDDYSQTLLENAVDGEVLRMLVGSREELEKAGFKKLGHRAKLFLFFEKLASSRDNNQKTGITQSRSNYVDRDRHGEHVDTSERAVNDASRRQSTERRLFNSRSSVDGEAAINVQQTTAKWPTYDQIFKQRASGKVLLKDKFPKALTNLHAGHQVIRSWFKNHETEQLQRDILFEDFKLNPDMKKVLADFIHSRMHELPALTFQDPEDNEGSSYTMKWKAETVYLYVITHRQEFRKNQKRRQSASSSTEGKKQTQYDPLAQLMSDEPQLMSNILKGGKIGFYVLKERPTSEGLKLRGKMNFIGDSAASVDELDLFVAMGVPVGADRGSGQKIPYYVHHIRITHLLEGYNSKPVSEYFVPYCVTTESNPLKASDLQLVLILNSILTLNIDLLGDIKPETTAAAKESNESFKACDGPLLTEEEEDTCKVVHSKGTSEVKPVEDHSRRSQSFREQGSPVASATSQENDELQLQNGSQIDRKEEILPITRSAFVDLTKLQDLKSKLGDEAFSVIAMVLTGSLNKDEVPTRLKDFIAKQNKSCPNSKPFQGHSTWSVGKKTKMVVEWAFDSQRIQLVGLAKSKQGKLIISRSNVELLNSSS